MQTWLVLIKETLRGSQSSPTPVKNSQLSWIQWNRDGWSWESHWRRAPSAGVEPAAKRLEVFCEAPPLRLDNVIYRSHNRDHAHFVPTYVTLIDLEKALSDLAHCREVTQLSFRSENSLFPAASISDDTRATPHQSALLDRMDQAASLVGFLKGAPC